MPVYLKLAGPNTKGLNPKGCYTKGWTDPFYKGVAFPSTPVEEWLGLRLDDYIVVDCDNEEAMESWRAHIGYGVGDEWDTWTRRTPNGWHFIYKRTVDTYGVKAKVPWFLPKVDLKVGPGHLIVYRAPGYGSVYRHNDPAPFQLAWLPAVMETAKPVEEWSELPDGQGDSFMISLAGKMRSWGMEQSQIFACLKAINKLTMTENPMPIASLSRLAKSASRYEPDERTTIECLKCGAEMEIA